MTQPTRFWEVEPDTWRMMIDTNVNGPFLMARAAAPRMMRAGWGRIVSISVSTPRCRPGFLSLRPVEGGAGASETIIWAEDSRHGVTVNALLPGGATRTGMLPDVLPSDARAAMLDPGDRRSASARMVSDETDGISGCHVTPTCGMPAIRPRRRKAPGWGSAATDKPVNSVGHAIPNARACGRALKHMSFRLVGWSDGP